MQEADRVTYRAACRAANTEINASRTAFYHNRLLEADGDQRAIWRVTTESPHSDDRSPDIGAMEAKRLSYEFTHFFGQKLKKIADDIRIRLSNASDYYRHPTSRQIPSSLDVLNEVSVDEVTRMIKAMPPKTSSMDYLPISLLKSSVEVMAPLIARLANLSFRDGVFPESLKHGCIIPLSKNPALDKADSKLQTHYQSQHPVQAAWEVGTLPYMT